MGRTMIVVGVCAILAVAAPMAHADEDKLSVVKGYLAAWNAHDAEKAASYFADDVTYLDVTVGEPQVGRPAARDNVIKVFMAAAPDLVWTMKGEPVADDDSVAFEWTFKGINTGAWSAETPATGKPFRFDGVTVMHLKDGKIAYQGDYYDGYGFQKQLGWIQ
jgi:steroid delta-isomerase-like uncharacterized protein